MVYTELKSKRDISELIKLSNTFTESGVEYVRKDGTVMVVVDMVNSRTHDEVNALYAIPEDLLAYAVE